MFVTRLHASECSIRSIYTTCIECIICWRQLNAHGLLRQRRDYLSSFASPLTLRSVYLRDGNARSFARAVRWICLTYKFPNKCSELEFFCCCCDCVCFAYAAACHRRQRRRRRRRRNGSTDMIWTETAHDINNENNHGENACIILFCMANWRFACNKYADLRNTCTHIN